LIHDLYPVPIEQRVLEALDTVRPYMESHGGNVELLAVEDGIARLALQGSCNGCAASRATLELAIKQALDEHAPDLAGLEVQGVTPEPAPAIGGFELPMVHAGGGAAPLPMADRSPPARWVQLDGAAALEPSELRRVEVEGVGLLLASVDGSLLAYRDACAACGEPLHAGRLTGGMLRCAACGVEFDLPRAGRAAGGEPLQLTPVPLLESGGVRVAV
jgi:Fe-S cluster biogenesis protein NfuA/nitrite reductase/ring-hydroxylating ferredoxin subunit